MTSEIGAHAKLERDVTLSTDAEILRHHASMEKNASGEIPRTELRAWMTKHLHRRVSPEEVTKIMLEIDQDGSGAISLEEWIAFHNAHNDALAAGAMTHGVAMSLLSVAPTQTMMLLRFSRSHHSISKDEIADRLRGGRLGTVGSVPAANAIRMLGFSLASMILFQTYSRSVIYFAGPEALARGTLPPGERVSLKSVMAAGAVGGAAHALATTPIVTWQRTGHFFRHAGLPITMLRDSLSFSVFFATYTLAHRSSRGCLQAVKVDYPLSATVFSSAACGGLAGLTCHTVRLPFSAYHKRGYGWVSLADADPRTDVLRFYASTARSIISATLAFGMLEFAFTVNGQKH